MKPEVLEQRYVCGVVDIEARGEPLNVDLVSSRQQQPRRKRSAAQEQHTRPSHCPDNGGPEVI